MCCKKIRIVMVCHFSNMYIREKLPLSNRYLYNFARKILCLPSKSNKYSDIAIWDTEIINSMKKRDDVELNVISAHSGLKRNRVSFLLDNVYYNFLRCEFATFLKRVIRNDELWRYLNPMSKRIKRIVNNINPDIVLLVGAENSYYSSSILAISNYPIYVLCQTIYNNPEFSKIDSKNASTELKIFKKEKYIGVYCDKHYNLLRGLGYDNYIFKFNWPINNTTELRLNNDVHKKYDFINFALHMSNDKGFPDCVKALFIVKQKYPNVTLNLIDGGNDEEREIIKKLIIEYNLSDNVSFTPFFTNIDDLFIHIQSVRYAVLPCKVDHISGTQLQSMQYGVPVVCYETTGTPLLNKEKECVLIAEKNNIDDLAKKMLLLLDNPSKADELRTNAFEYSINRIKNSENNNDNIINNIKSIINHYNNNIQIPVDQLYKIDN